jgi:hypothetical protein
VFRTPAPSVNGGSLTRLARGGVSPKRVIFGTFSPTHCRERRKAILLRKPYLRASGKPFGALA